MVVSIKIVRVANLVDEGLNVADPDLHGSASAWIRI